MSTSFEHTIIRLWRAQRTESPPSSVDQAILAAARRQGGRGRPRWYAVAASVATIGLAVGLGWRLNERYAGPAAPPGHGPVAEQTATEFGAPPPTVAPIAPSPAAAGDRPVAAGPPPEARVPTAGRPAAPRAESSRAAAPDAAPFAPSVATARLPAPAAAAAADELRARQPKSAALPAAVESKEWAGFDDEAAPAPLGQALPTEASGEPLPPAAATEASSSARVRSRLDAGADLPADPDAWVARIRALLASGETDAARALLERGRRAHPDWPVPEDLRALLE